MFDLEFWRNFLSNALATFVGIIIGIPVALWINRIQQRISDASETQRLATEATAKKRKILKLLSIELRQNKGVLELIQQYYKQFDVDASDVKELIKRIVDFREKHKEQIKIQHIYLLRMELWNALSNGGEFQWIRDLDLLHTIATAYEATKMVNYVGRSYIALKSDIEIHFGSKGIQSDSLREDHNELFLDFMAHLRISIESIDSALEKILKEETNT